MEKPTLTFCRVFLTILSALMMFSVAMVQAADLVSVKDGLLSVNLEETSLLDAAREIEKQSGVWFRGDEKLFQEKISITFKDLSLEEGLKRILTNLNYSLMFDAESEVAGVMVMGEGAPAVSQPEKPGARPPRVTTSPRTTTSPAPTVRTQASTTRPTATMRRPPRVLPQRAQGATASQFPGSSAAQSPLPDAFKVQENAPPPGGPVASDGPLPPAFRVIQNAPPPGGTPQGTAASPGESKSAAGTSSLGDATKDISTP
jgi:hypothetical protein